MAFEAFAYAVHPPTSVEEPKEQRPESYSICDTDSPSHVFPGPKKSQANKLEKTRTSYFSQQQQGVSKQGKMSNLTVGQRDACALIDFFQAIQLA